MAVIGIVGTARSGKSELAQALAGEGFARVRFADPLKNMLYALGLRLEEIEGALKEEPCELLGGRTPRYAMQTTGKEWGRDLIDSQIWLRAWMRTASKHAHVVAEDVRFQNEVDTIRSLGGIIIRVSRPGIMPRADHVSEALIVDPSLNPEIELINDGSLEAWRMRGTQIAEKMIGGA